MKRMSLNFANVPAKSGFVTTLSPIGTCRLSSRVSFRLLQGFEKDVTVAGGESDATVGGESRGNVGGSSRQKIVAGLEAETHKKDGLVLVVVVGDAVTGAVRALLSCGSAIHHPVRLWDDEEVAAAARKIAEDHVSKGG